MGKLKKLAITFGVIFFLWIILLMAGSTSPYLNDYNSEIGLSKMSSSDCRFLGYQIDAYEDTFGFSAFAGDDKSLQEYAELQKKYNDNCV